MKILVQFSGGKDSLAALIWTVNEFGNSSKVKAVFCDTGWENPITMKHIDYVVEKLGVELVVLRSKKYANFLEMSKGKNRFPSSKARFCTVELKVNPFIDYVLGLQEDILIIQGIRKDESTARTKMSHQCQYFKGYFEPVSYNKKGKPVFHTYRKKEVFDFVKNFGQDVIRPHFNQNAMEIFQYINEKGINVNELYRLGRERVGCDPCIMESHDGVRAMIDYTPITIEKVREAEKYVGTTFFPPKYIPLHACSNRKFPTVDDVVKYLQGKRETLPIFEKNVSCSSHYHLCE